MDSVDVRGIPKMNGGDVMSWAAPDWWISDPESRGVLVFDEITQGAASVMAALMQVVLERRLGNRILPPGWSILACANRETDRAGTNRMPSALSRRFTHINLEPDVPDWCSWALSSGRILPELVAYIWFRPELLHDFDPKRPVDPNPRAWERASRIVDMKLNPDTELQLLVGTVGEGAAIEATAFLRIWRGLPSIDGVLLNPTTTAIPAEPSAQFAIAGALARRATDRNFDSVLTYVERVGVEMLAYCVKDAVARDPTLQATRSFVTWSVKYQELFS